VVTTIRTLTSNRWLKDAGYTVEEEAKIYERNLQDIKDNTRWYLDNLDYLVGYKVSWHCYGKNKQPAVPMSVLKVERDARNNF
jgi:hypothetical protein